MREEREREGQGEAERLEKYEYKEGGQNRTGGKKELD